MSNIRYYTAPEEVSMGDQWFELATLDHFWIIWRFDFFKKFAKSALINDQRFFEVGCGHGIAINQFESNYTVTVDGCDLNEYALKKIQNNKGNIYCYNIYQKMAEFKEKYDGVILFDVIEHIDDDIDFLKTSCFHVKKGGLVMIDVPAYQSMYSKYDAVIGHKRRYTKKLLKERMEAAGITDVKLSYWGISLVPLLFIRKFVLLFKNDNIASDGFKSPQGFIKKVLFFVMRLELSLFSKPVIGTSLIAYGRKS